MTTYDVKPNDVLRDSSGKHYLVYLNYKDEPYASSGVGALGIRIDSLDQPEKLVTRGGEQTLYWYWQSLTPLPEPVAEPQEFGTRVTDANGVKWVAAWWSKMYNRRAWVNNEGGSCWWSDLAQPVTLGWSEDDE